MKNLRISGSRGAFYAFSINDDFPVSIDILYPRTAKAHLLHTFTTKFYIKPFNPCLSVFSAQIACIFLQELQLIWTCLPTLRYNSDWLVNHES